MKLHKKSKAFTLAEMMLTLAFIGILIGLTISNAIKRSPDMTITMFKKSYSTIETVVSALINDETLYPGVTGFLNTTPIESEFGETFGKPNPNTKFRDAFKYKVNVIEDNIDCIVYIPNNPTYRPRNCFMTDDGIVYGIPDSNFQDNVMRAIERTRLDGLIDRVSYFPITVYPEWEKVKNSNPNPSNDAFLIGILPNGKMSILALRRDCDGAGSSALECRAREFARTENLRSTED